MEKLQHRTYLKTGTPDTRLCNASNAATGTLKFKPIKNCTIFVCARRMYVWSRAIPVPRKCIKGNFYFLILCGMNPIRKDTSLHFNITTYCQNPTTIGQHTIWCVRLIQNTNYTQNSAILHNQHGPLHMRVIRTVTHTHTHKHFHCYDGIRIQTSCYLPHH